MSLFEKISEDLKTAMKSGDKTRLETLRSVKTALLLATKEKNSELSLTDSDALTIIQKLVKQRKESAEIYKNQNRLDLYEKEINELKILEEYLPKPISDEELTTYLKNLIQKLNINSVAEIGKIMQVAIRELAGKADGKIISEKARQLLSS